MNHFINLEKCVSGFCIDNQFVDCISNESVYKIDKHTKEIIYSKKLFKKEGFSRNLIANNILLFIRDFYTLYIMDKSNYSILSTLQLGTDLSSDICDITIDEKSIYACMRNGAIKLLIFMISQYKRLIKYHQPVYGTYIVIMIFYWA